MKKNILMIIIAGMLIFTLSSCDKLDSLLGGAGGAGGDQSGGEDVRYTITEEEWEALDSITNFTYKMVITSPSEDKTTTIFLTYKSTKDAKYEKRMRTSGVVDYLTESFFVTKDGKSYEVRADENGNWVGSETGYTVRSLLWCISREYAVSFDKLSYDAVSKSYIYTETENGQTLTLSYCFKNGSLINGEAKAMSYENGKEYVDERATFDIDHIDFTTIIAPDFTVAEQ